MWFRFGLSVLSSFSNIYLKVSTKLFENFFFVPNEKRTLLSCPLGESNPLIKNSELISGSNFQFLKLYPSPVLNLQYLLLSTFHYFLEHVLVFFDIVLFDK